jgi:adenine-specific DNA glycosylase
MAETVTPRQGSKSYNYALLDFTRAVCKPLPECPTCALLNLCSFGRRGITKSSFRRSSVNRHIVQPAELVVEPES